MRFHTSATDRGISMAEKEAENVQGGVSHGKREAAGRIVLVGTYKGDVPEDAERVIIRTADFAPRPRCGQSIVSPSIPPSVVIRRILYQNPP